MSVCGCICSRNSANFNIFTFHMQEKDLIPNFTDCTCKAEQAALKDCLSARIGFRLVFKLGNALSL